MILRSFLRLLAATLLTAALAPTVAWSDPVPSVSAPELGGYSPVSYFTENRAELGTAEFAVAHQGKVYYLTSVEQQALFAENPDQYQPRFPICPFSLVSGQTMAIDPTNFKVVGKSLLLFHKSAKGDGLVGWQGSGLSDAELIDRADKKFVLLNF